jgi:hypothetical protein
MVLQAHAAQLYAMLASDIDHRLRVSDLSNLLHVSFAQLGLMLPTRDGRTDAQQAMSESDFAMVLRYLESEQLESDSQYRYVHQPPMHSHHCHERWVDSRVGEILVLIDFMCLQAFFFFVGFYLFVKYFSEKLLQSLFSESFL